ncbi:MULTISPECIES: fibronectin type III domain-containing protein [unclassified Chryseobacterium]|uniref:Ig-like domain-containing protein n=1 Tax=unclassified Chryseobacterium TaxID=2593645 RepID=UPI0022698195|nr:MULTISPECIES: fibronectin type III domain-containing protein [unclassified Chryseobacterium]
MKNFYKKTWDRYVGLRNAGVAVLVILGAMQRVNAQVADYAFAQSTGFFNSIAATGILVPGSEATVSNPGNNDTAGWDVSIPFNFKFNGSDYTSMYVNSNGGVTFGTLKSDGLSLISSTITYSAAIAVMNRDLNGEFETTGNVINGSNMITSVASFKGIAVGKKLKTIVDFGNITVSNGIASGATITAFNETAGTITMSLPATKTVFSAPVIYGTGKVFTSVEGVAPNRTFVVEWLGYNDNATEHSYLNFQLRLAETTNKVSIVYGSQFIESTANKPTYVGFRGASKSDFNNRAGTSWSNSSAGTASNSSLSRNNTNFPASGLTFTWSPPSCPTPGAVVIADANIAQTTAIASWAAPSLIPANGYEIYYSTVNVAPTSATVLDATNSVASNTTSAQITGLTPSTLYYVWVRSLCDATSKSIWTGIPIMFTTLCQTPSLSTTGGLGCPGGAVMLSATPSAGAVVNWYNSSLGGSILATGNTFTTPMLNNTTTYYASALTGVIDTAGLASPAVIGGWIAAQTNTTWGVYFTVKKPAKFKSIDVFPVQSGQSGAINIVNGTVSLGGSAFATIPFTTNVSGGTTAQTVALDIDLPPGDYTIYPTLPSGGLMRNMSGAIYPYVSSVASITGNGYNENYYMCFYNFKFVTGCESERYPVVATVNSSGCLNTGEANLENKLSLYPNPFTELLHVSDVSKVKSISVMDVSGRLVKTFDKPSSSLSLGDLKQAVYFISLELIDGSKQTVRVIRK